MTDSYFYSILKHAPKLCIPVSAGLLFNVINAIKQGELSGYDTVKLVFGIGFTIGGTACYALNKLKPYVIDAISDTNTQGHPGPYKP